MAPRTLLKRALSHAAGVTTALQSFVFSEFQFVVWLGRLHVAMGHNLWRSRFGVDEHPFASYFDVHQGFPGV